MNNRKLGASGWIYRLITEAILGISIQGNTLVLNPCVTETWKEWKVTLSLEGNRWTIIFTDLNFVSTGIEQIQVIAKVVSGNRIELLESNTDNVVQFETGNSL